MIGNGKHGTRKRCARWKNLSEPSRKNVYQLQKKPPSLNPAIQQSPRELNKTRVNQQATITGAKAVTKEGTLQNTLEKLSNNMRLNMTYE
jgi:hypothetical protein